MEAGEALNDATEGIIGGVRYQIEDVETARIVHQTPLLKETAAALTSWANAVQGRELRGPQSLLNATRNTYTSNGTDIGELKAAYRARKDDVVGGALDVLEGLALQGVKFEGESLDESDVYNQVAADIDLDSLLRKMFRELMTYSQVTIAVTWHTKEFKLRGRTVVESVDPADQTVVDPKMKVGRRRRGSYTIKAPGRVVILNPTAVIPVGDYEAGRGRLAYAVTESTMRGWRSDPLLSEIVEREYRVTDSEEIKWVGEQGLNIDQLLLLREDRVARHCLTKSDYERYPDVRLSSVFPLLDLKEQLRRADRTTLVGVANHLILVRKGTEKQPGTQREIDNLQRNVDVLATLPVLVSDHRLMVDIVSPDMSNTLNNDRYDTLDRRIMSRVIGALSVASSGQRNESTLTTGRMVARLLESRRHMIKRFLEQVIFDPMQEASRDNLPSNRLVDGAGITFVPKQVELDNDANFYSTLQAARARNDLSRESYLEAIGFDSAVELQRVLNEELSGANAVFQSFTPYTAPNNGQPTPNQELKTNDTNAPSKPGAQPNGGPGRPMGGGGTQ